MRLTDCLRIGIASIGAHKRRTLAVVIIVGLLFSIITAGAMFLQELENATLSAMLAPTDGKVLLATSVDLAACGEDCNLETEIASIKQNIDRYGGNVVESQVISTPDGTFYQISDLFSTRFSNLNDDVMQIAVPLTTAAALADLPLPGLDVNLSTRLHAVKDIYGQTLHQTITSPTGEQYYISTILPSTTYAEKLTFISIGIFNYPLEAIFNQIHLGDSRNFLLNPVVTPSQTDYENPSHVILATFDDLAAAYAYSQDEVNYCDYYDHMLGLCSKEYRYQVASMISDPPATYQGLQDIWFVFRVIAIILTALAVVIALSTYIRLINQDTKIIALYRTTGATKHQVQYIYLTYLLILSLFIIIFSLLAGFALVSIFNLSQLTIFSQLFTVNFGATQDYVWLVGWSDLILCLMGVILLTAILAVLFSGSSFKAKSLAKNLK